MAPNAASGLEGAGLMRLTRADVEEHNRREDRWLVIDSKVYDVTRWGRRHPGGSKLLSYYAGHDATEAFTAFHASNMDYAQKFLKPLLVGVVTDPRTRDAELIKDFESLRVMAKKKGLFTPSYTFYALMFLHVVAAYVGGHAILYWYGVGPVQCLLSVALLVLSQSQINWLQHDVGHLSVFKRGWLNYSVHLLLFGVMKGVSPNWWNHMHFQHHSKPNVIGKDPDVRIEQFFVLGTVMPLEAAKNKDNKMPYNWQHKYFHLIGPPLLLPVYFQIMTYYHAFTRRLWLEMVIMSVFYVQHIVFFSSYYGLAGALFNLFVVRVLDSHWFTWVSQSNHIPMAIKYEDHAAWVKQQISATCNIEKSFFNDWFTGHLNFQAEHHLFPTMPRHNLYKIAPLVKSLCQKHGVDYQVKTLGGAFQDIVRSLKKSGELWLHAYEELNPGPPTQAE